MNTVIMNSTLFFPAVFFAVYAFFNYHRMANPDDRPLLSCKAMTGFIYLPYRPDISTEAQEHGSGASSDFSSPVNRQIKNLRRDGAHNTIFPQSPKAKNSKAEEISFNGDTTGSFVSLIK